MNKTPQGLGDRTAFGLGISAGALPPSLHREGAQRPRRNAPNIDKLVELLLRTYGPEVDILTRP